MATNETSFGEVLKRKRLEKGLTQRELADGAGVDASYISQLEHGRKFPAAKTLESLAAALGIGVGELLVMYFPESDDSPKYPVIVGDRGEKQAFEDALLSTDNGIISYYAGRGYGKTYLIKHRLIPICYEKGLPYLYIDGNRIAGYGQLLTVIRNKFDGRGASYKGFDEISAQVRSIEERLSNRYNDPFSTPIPADQPDISNYELSYAEKYIYRDMERLLTEELLTGLSAYLADAPKTTIFIDGFDRLSLLSEYWLNRLIRRLHDRALLGDKLILVFAGNKTLSVESKQDIPIREVELRRFDDTTVESYFASRDIEISEIDRQIIIALEGHPASIALWSDYFEAKDNFPNNNAEELLHQLNALLSSYEDFDQIRLGELLYVKLKRRLGRLTHIQGRLTQADEYYGAASSMLRRMGDEHRDERGKVLLDWGTVCRHRGEWQRALTYYTRAQKILTGIGDSVNAAVAHLGAGTTLRLLGKYSKSEAEYDTALTMIGENSNATGISGWIASILSNLSIVRRLEAIELHLSGEPKQASVALKEAANYCERAVDISDNPAEKAVAQNRLALCHYVEGRWQTDAGQIDDAQIRFEKAVTLHKKAMVAFENLGDKYRIAQVEADMGLIAKTRKQHSDAIVHFRSSLSFFEQMGSKYHTAKVLVQLGCLSEGEEQLSYFGEALRTAFDHNAESLQSITREIIDELNASPERMNEFFNKQNIDIDDLFKETTG